MRIIAGKFGSRRIEVPQDPQVRPTKDRVREALFSMLSSRLSLDGVRVLDLFSGSGALGIEALSRGAGSVVMVEKSPKIAASIQRNIQELACEESADVVVDDCFSFLSADNARDKFDIIFADPPYAYNPEEVLSSIFSSEVCSDKSYVIYESAESLNLNIDDASFELLKSSKYGDTVVSLFVCK